MGMMAAVCDFIFFEICLGIFLCRNLITEFLIDSNLNNFISDYQPLKVSVK